MQLLPGHKRSNNLGLERGASCYLERACLLKATELENHLTARLAGLFHLKRGDKLKLGMQGSLVSVLSRSDHMMWVMGAGVDRFCPKGIPFLTTVTLVLS